MISIHLVLRTVFRPHRLAWPRTLPFQGSNTGSNPVGDTTTLNSFTKTGHSRLKLWAMLALE